MDVWTGVSDTTTAHNHSQLPNAKLHAPAAVAALLVGGLAVVVVRAGRVGVHPVLHVLRGVHRGREAVRRVHAQAQDHPLDALDLQVELLAQHHVALHVVGGPQRHAAPQDELRAGVAPDEGALALQWQKGDR